MDVLQALETRRAIRAYTPEPVDRGTVEGLLRAATLAPSALNAQPWAFVVVQEPARLASCAARAKAHLLARPPGWMPDRLREKLEDPAYDLLHRAPALVVFCARPGALEPGEDCALAGMNFMLAAHARGLGTCPIGLARPWLNEPGVKAELGIPADCAPTLAFALGHPAEVPPPTERRPPEILAWL